MQKLQFTIVIKAPANKVYRTMLGLDDIKTYETWTYAFNPTSTYKGTWEKDTKMYFIGTGENGKQGGMVSIVEEHIANRFISLRHVAALEGEKEITEGADLEKWAGGHENYAFEEINDATTVTVETDSPEGFEDYFNNTWPKALEKLKHILEKPYRVD